jgi:tripartite-type tricarboxylate transporter receptor subunit TctC
MNKSSISFTATHTRNIRLAASCCLSSLLATLAMSAVCQPLGNRPLTIIAPFSAGTSSDVVARGFAGPLEKALGQSVIVVNRDGGSGVVGIKALLQSPADGYTVSVSPMTPLVVQPYLVRNLGLSPASVSPVCNIAENVLGIVVRHDSSLEDMRSLVTAAKSRPLSFGSAGPNSTPQMGVERLKAVAGGEYIHVPYRGDPPSLQDLLGGRLDFSSIGVIAGSPNIKAGKLRLLGVFSGRRHPEFPDVPTMKEQGINVEQLSYTSMYAAAGTSEAVLERLERACRQAVNSDEFQRTAANIGMVIDFRTGAELRRALEAEHDTFGRLLRSLGIQRN